MSDNKLDEHQEVIETIFRENVDPIDSDLVLILAHHLMSCSNAEYYVFYLRDKRPPEDIISIYTYLKNIEFTRMMIFEQKIYSEDYADFRLKTILGLLALSPVIQEITQKNIDEVEFSNAIERLDFYQKAASELSEMEFSSYIRQAIENNPNLLSLRTYFLVSVLTYQHLAQMQSREEYAFYREIQGKVLIWRQKYLKKDN